MQYKVSKLTNALVAGYGSDFDNIDYQSPDYEMLNNLEKNVYSFSAASNYHELKDMTMALKDGDKARTYKDFMEKAMNISYQYNVNWLRTEYDFALNAANMAARWVDFEKGKKLMPLLKYSTVGDSRVRAEHAAIDGVTKNIDDPWWSTHFPPNGWGCRCGAQQEPFGVETPEDNTPYVKIAPMFRTNLAKQQLAFPKSHPFFKDTPLNVLEDAEKIRIRNERQDIKYWAKKNLLDKKIFNAGLNDKISISVKGIKEVLNQPHKHYSDKNKIIYSLDKIISEAKLYKSSPNYKPNSFINKFHYLETKINKEVSYIIIGENDNGDKFLYSIVDSIKKSD